MRILHIHASAHVRRKVQDKHGVVSDELSLALREGNPYFIRTGIRRYLALAKSQRYLTIVFDYRAGVAEIRTAYPSPRRHQKLYLRKT